MGVFNLYLNEAINLDVAKQTLKGTSVWNYKERYVDEFDNKYRIVIGDIEPDNTFLDGHPLYNKLELIFLKGGYILTMQSYIEGYVTKGMQRYKIGKLLQKIGDNDELVDAFKRDPLRSQNRRPYSVVVSKHPYDILGASTDRNWTSCINLGIENIVYSYKNEKGSNAEIFTDSLSAPYFVAYLVDPDDVTSSGELAIRRPVSRILIYPFVKRDNPDTYAWSVGDVYGLEHNKFLPIVKKWVDQLNDTHMQTGLYDEIPDIFYDSYDSTMVKLNYSEDEMLKHANTTMKHIDVHDSIELDRGTYHMHDVTLKNLIGNEVVNHPLWRDTTFFDAYIEPALQHLLNMSAIGDIYETEVDSFIYNVYDNGTILLDAIPLGKLPPNLRSESNTDYVDTRDILNVILEALILFDESFNDHASAITANLDDFLGYLDRYIQTKLVELGVDPDLSNWQRVDLEQLSDYIYDDLYTTF